MRRIWRWLRWIPLLGLAVLLALAVWAFVRARRALPETAGEVAVAGLGGEVKVTRDAFGVPSISAASERDLFFAQGYVHAQDRLWQMHFNRTLASGRLTSLFGPGPLQADKYLRTLGLRHLAEGDYAALSPETRGLLDAYAAGVNAFLESHKNALPLEFAALRVTPEPWTPVDSLVWSRMLGFNLSLNGQLELARQALVAKVGPETARRLVPPYPADGPVVLRDYVPAAVDAARVGGSNAWVIAGSRTATGKPLLANDTHLGLGMPSVWYQIHLAGGRFDVAGFSIPGIPFVFIGQNRRVAWGITNLNADVQDVFLEKLDNPKKPTRYQFAGQWLPLTVRREEIRLGKRTEVLEVRSTRHGPLVNGRIPTVPEDGPPAAFTWAAAAPNRLLDGVSALDRADGGPAVRAALGLWDSPSLNVVYADVDGNIGYQATARVPIRPKGGDGTLPVPGWTGEHEWQGFIPYADMPHAENPAAGAIATANHKVVPDSYPYFLTGDWPPPDRARRLETLLAEHKSFGLDDMKRMQLDTFYEPAVHDRPIFAAAAKPATELEKQALAAFTAWDGHFDTEAAGPAIYTEWSRLVTEGLSEDEMGPEVARKAGQLVYAQSEAIRALLDHPDDPLWDDQRTKGQVEHRDDILRRTFPQAVQWLAARFGKDPEKWRWGRVHYAALLHQPLGPIPVVGGLFSGKRFAIAGDSGTVNSIAGEPERQPFRAVFGVSQRFIADLADLGRSLAVNSSGPCALVGCPGRDDETARWARGEYHPLLAPPGAAVLTLRPATAKGAR